MILAGSKVKFLYFKVITLNYLTENSHDIPLFKHIGASNDLVSLTLILSKIFERIIKVKFSAHIINFYSELKLAYFLL